MHHGPPIRLLLSARSVRAREHDAPCGRHGHGRMEQPDPYGSQDPQGKVGGYGLIDRPTLACDSIFSSNCTIASRQPTIP